MLSLTPRANFGAYQVTEGLDALVSPAGAAQEPAGGSWNGTKGLRQRVCRAHAQPLGRPEWGCDRMGRSAPASGSPGRGSRPTTATMEWFNGRLRAECLNAPWFLSLADARDRIEEGMCHYNEDRPLMNPGGFTPKAFAN
ncbi:integrase core domain-containing protein [Methylobacterium sp. Leaf106]|uniref:integrase core domain-containing protein n=1 Tax=Methylobacterium sp. Leaf106 TaxID=1736255 RepID=UPI003FCE9FCF